MGTCLLPGDNGSDNVRAPTDSSSDQRRDRLFGPGYVDLLTGDDVGVYERFDDPHDQVCQVVWWQRRIQLICRDLFAQKGFDGCDQPGLDRPGALVINPQCAFGSATRESRKNAARSISVANRPMAVAMRWAPCPGASSIAAASVGSASDQRISASRSSRLPTQRNRVARFTPARRPVPASRSGGRPETTRERCGRPPAGRAAGLPSPTSAPMVSRRCHTSPYPRNVAVTQHPTRSRTCDIYRYILHICNIFGYDADMASSTAMPILDRFRLDDRVAIVTGASSGLGVAFAHTLAEAGAHVVLGARREQRLADTRALVESVGRNALAVRADVSDPLDCQALVGAATEAFGRVDILVNNAGVGTAVPATRETPDQFRSVIDVNLNGCYWMAQACAAVMKPGSSIINISSVLGPDHRRAAAGRLRLVQGGSDRPDPRSRPTMDRPQGHPGQRARAGLLRIRDDRPVRQQLLRYRRPAPHPDRTAGPGRTQRRTDLPRQ